MAERNFLGRATGRAGERLLLGSNNYDRRTGQFRNVMPGLIGRAAQTVIGAFGGPLIGAIAGRGINKLVDRFGSDPEFVQPESIPISIDSGAPSSFQNRVAAPSPMTVSNLGLGAQSPGGDWRGYLQGAGSVNNFGNQSFMRPGSFTNWSPTSGWGQQLMAQQPADGSLAGFGNNVGGFLSGGARSGSGGVRSPVASSGSRAGLTRSGGSAAGWVTAINQGEILGQFQGDPERYTRKA